MPLRKLKKLVFNKGKKLCLCVLLMVIIGSCRNNSKSNTSSKDTDCGQIQTIKGLGFYFNHYPYKKIDSIFIKSEDIWKGFLIDKAYTDGLRQQRYFYFDRVIKTTDTLQFKFRDSIVHSVYGFKYVLRPHAASGSVSYGCDFYELVVDGKKQTGGVVSL